MCNDIIKMLHVRLREGMGRESGVDWFPDKELFSGGAWWSQDDEGIWGGMGVHWLEVGGCGAPA